MINTRQAFIDFIGGRGDITDPEANQSRSVFLHIILSTHFIGEKIDTTGDLSLWGSCPYLSDQTVLPVDVSGQISVGSLRVSAERSGGGELKKPEGLS